MSDDVLVEGCGVRPPWKLSVARAEAGGEAIPLAEEADDAELVGAVLQGSQEAFERIVARHQKGIYQLCYRYVGSHEDANDLTQEVFLRAYSGLARFRGRASLKTWLYRIGINVCLNRVTSKAVRLDQAAPLETVETADARSESPAEIVLRRERAERVRAAIARLPPKQRTTLILRVYQELPHEEIAKVLGTSANACKVNLFHAVHNLKRLLEP